MFFNGDHFCPCLLCEDKDYYDRAPHFGIVRIYLKIMIYKCLTMEQRTLKNVNNCFNTNISFYLETSGGQNSDLYLNFHFFNASLN